MNWTKKMMVVLAMTGGAWLLAPASMALSGCGGAGGGTGGSGGGSATGGGTGSTGGGSGGGSGSDCFMGTPTTNDQLLNACTDPTVEKILKQTSWRDPGITLPALP